MLTYCKIYQKWKSFFWTPYIAFMTAFMITIASLTTLPRILLPELLLDVLTGGPIRLVLILGPFVLSAETPVFC